MQTWTQVSAGCLPHVTCREGDQAGMDMCSRPKNKEKQAERAIFLLQDSLRKRFHTLFSECRITPALYGLVFSPLLEAEAIIWSSIQAHKNLPEEKNTWSLVVYLLAEENTGPFLQHRMCRNCNQILSERGLTLITSHKDFHRNYVLHIFCPIYQNYKTPQAKSNTHSWVHLWL